MQLRLTDAGGRVVARAPVDSAACAAGVAVTEAANPTGSVPQPLGPAPPCKTHIAGLTTPSQTQAYVQDRYMSMWYMRAVATSVYNWGCGARGGLLQSCQLFEIPKNVKLGMSPVDGCNSRLRGLMGMLSCQGGG